jgi:hypothetical protein
MHPILSTTLTFHGGEIKEEKKTTFHEKTTLHALSILSSMRSHHALHTRPLHALHSLHDKPQLLKNVNERSDS